VRRDFVAAPHSGGFVPNFSTPRPRRRAALLALLALLSLAVGLVGLTGPAQAAGGSSQRPAPTYYNTKYTMLNHTKVTDYVDTTHRLGSCENPGHSCTITVTRSSTRTFGLALGVTVKFVAGQLNISTSSTVSVANSCSAKTPKGYYLNAYPRGSRHQYKIRKTVTAVYSPYRTTETPGTTTSGYLHTFNPYKNAITCRLVHK
jgi:hypothetical protein